MTPSKSFPIWFTLLTAVLFISNLLIFGIATLLNPNLAFPDAGAAAAFPIQFFAVRHIAFAFPLLYGLVWKDAKVLAVMYSIFALMSVLDIALLAIYSDYIPVLVRIPLVAQLPPMGRIVLAVSAFLFPVGVGLRFLTAQLKIGWLARST